MSPSPQDPTPHHGARGSGPVAGGAATSAAGGVVGAPPSRVSAPPVSVAVLVDLERRPLAGGHVKCWERFAEAAAGRDDVDLTLYVLGRQGHVEDVSENVRVVSLRPVVPTRPVLGSVGGVDVTDLAPFSPSLARRLPAHDVWHATHQFAFSTTAARLARRTGHPLVGSVHTDVPVLTEVYATQVVDRLSSARAREALRRARLVERAVASARRRRDGVLAACGHVLVSNPADAADISGVVPAERTSLLRRGVDTDRFGPDEGARARLEQSAGVPPDAALVLFAGRVDATKGVMVVASAVRRLREEGRPVHLVVAGRGADTGRVRAELGDGVTMLGPLAQPELAAVYPACDVLAFPSRSETAGNVVAEAMACGVPVALPRGARTNVWLEQPGEDGVLVDGDDAAAWAACLGALLADPGRRRAVARRALETARRSHPSWRQVLAEDLLPVWQRAAPRTPRDRAHAAPVLAWRA